MYVIYFPAYLTETAFNSAGFCSIVIFTQPLLLVIRHYNDIDCVVKMDW